MTEQVQPLDRSALQQLCGERKGPYNSFNPVSRVQVWQWCGAMGEQSPLYLDDDYRDNTEFDRLVAPPAMMQMWTMRDVHMRYAPGSTAAHPYQVMFDLERAGFPANVAVSYDITFHRYLLEGDRAHHYTTVVDISELKTTALGQGHFFTERVEYLDQHEALFAQALITYFQYRPGAAAAGKKSARAAVPQEMEAAAAPAVDAGDWQTDYTDVEASELVLGQALPQLRIPVSHTLIVAGAIATQDFIPVHHNVQAANAAAMPDIFMNILTTCGLCARYLGDWAGPGSRLQRLQFALMAPNTPGDSMTMQGRVNDLSQTAGQPCVSVEFAGINSLGPHVKGTATLTLTSTAQR